ncbi:hypothetical protein ONS95_013322 [Cadophora gregata]|uniref:uncharacterized protein n=1 Tax=Cadophora gregata TaxID=51156 RepID=UPI0026DDA06C|nr:uncharacterized protein ONS95_013322 [Cadophora gregata]KAK0099850.1 hypothetical protein ONS96_007803 [Cadophora gregata f. sp. sojae]KAK0116301.1 hypothetical protein ONS95_013322 [Cadophora gregata]
MRSSNPLTRFMYLGFLSLFFAQHISAVFFITKSDDYHAYQCGPRGEKCCASGAVIYRIWSSPQPPASCSGCGCGTIKNEAISSANGGLDHSELGRCKYGDYVGNGNVWAFCQTPTGGDLYLNGQRKICQHASITVSTCTDGFCGNSQKAVITCNDDRWYPPA